MRNDGKPLVSHLYNRIFLYNAKIGNLKENYRLYLDYKKRNGILNGGMYTSMFNTCANCKNSFFALEKATAIREQLANDKNYSINLTNYNAMLKGIQTTLVIAEKKKKKIINEIK